MIVVHILQLAEDDRHEAPWMLPSLSVSIDPFLIKSTGWHDKYHHTVARLAFALASELGHSRSRPRISMLQ